MSELDYQMALILQHKFEQESKAKGSNSDDADLEYARQLHEQFEKEKNIENPINNLVYEAKKRNPNLDSTKCLVDPSWEVIDPTPDIHTLFMAFNEKFFWNKLLSVCVSWSKRMTSCAGICAYSPRGGMCSITLSEPLLKLRPRKDLVETLLHEMIHALLFVTHNNRDRDGHGPEFHKHMYRINNQAGTKISVYHDFHDEVNLYKQHWWKCNGPCQKRKPFFGMVRRATNRAPGHYDRWFKDHLTSCGGTFIKVKEPEKPLKNSKTTDKSKETKNTPTRPDIRNYINTTKKNNSNTPKAMPSSTVTSSTNRTNSNKTTNVHTINSTDNKAKVVPVIPSKVSNIFGFTNLDGGSCSSSKPSTSKGSSNSKGTGSISGFAKGSNGIKGATSNRSNTLVINGKNDAKASGSKTEIIPENKNTEVFNGQGKVLSSTPAKKQDYSVVRNHWLNKFSSTEENASTPVKSIKRSNSGDTKASKLPKCDRYVDVSSKNKETNSKTTKNDSDKATCPICDNKFSITEINTHIDECLVTKKDDKKCIICDKKIALKEYEKHVILCTDKHFNDVEDFGIDSDEDNVSYDRIDKTEDYINKGNNENVNSKNNEPAVSNEDKIINIDPDDDDLEQKECPVCNELLASTNYDRHVEKCLLKMYDNLKKDLKESPCGSEVYIDCLACGKKILKDGLSEHLEECMDESIFEEKSSSEKNIIDLSEEDNNIDSAVSQNDTTDSSESFNCPCCMKLIPANVINSHIDECLNITNDSEGLFDDDF